MAGQYCPICGLDQEEDIRHLTGRFCACCGVEYLTDFERAGVIEIRQKWIAGGYSWFRPHLRPPGWDPEEQMKNIPQEYQ